MDLISVHGSSLPSNDTSHHPDNSTSSHHGCVEHGEILGYRDHILVMPISLPAAEGGFSSGLALGPIELLIGYIIVATFAVILDLLSEYLETRFKGSHQIIIQRIYRSIMVLGCATVILKICAAGNLPLSHELSLAYEFADMTSFMTALFFAFQGFIIMMISIADANAWYRAASIRVEDLLIDVETAQIKQPLLWKWVWLPFCRTRDQVEFRILRLIFSSSYHISGDPQVFNYAELLKRTHECNLLEIIDFNYWKWGIIIFIVGMTALKYHYGYSRTCENQSCVAYMELILFTSGGFLLVISSILLALAGRRSELKLLRRYGIYEPADYEIYLRKEEDILEKLGNHVLSKKALMALISDLKHDVAVKQFKKQHKLITHVSHHDSDEIGPGYGYGTGPGCGSGSGTGAGTGTGTGTGWSTKASSGKCKSGEGYTDIEEGIDSKDDHHNGGMKSTDRHVETGAGTGTEGGKRVANIANSFLNNLLKTKKSHSGNAVLPMHTSTSQPTPETCDSNGGTNPHNKISVFQVVSDDLAERQFRGNLLRSVDYENSGYVQVQNSDFRRPYGRQSSQETVRIVNNTVGLEEKMKHIDENGRVKLQPKLSPEEEKRIRHEAAREQVIIELAKRKLQHAYQEKRHHFEGGGGGGGGGHEATNASSPSSSSSFVLFRDIFLFGHPIYYTILISWLMTGNALYLAWWLTTFTFAASKLHSIGSAIFWFLFPLVPSILAFPLLAMSIKSSTNLKAITEIDLEIVSEVMEKNEEIRKYVNLLRKCLLHRLRLVGGMENERKAVSDLFEEVEDSHTGAMSLEDFRRMLVRLQMFLDKPIWLGMFSWIDLNHNGSISLEEFDRFLFPQRTAEEDKKKKKFFNNVNTKAIIAKGKISTAAEIQDSLVTAGSSGVDEEAFP